MKLKHTISLLSIILLIFTLSCKKKKVSDPLIHDAFKSIIKLKGEEVDLNSTMLNEPSGMIIIDPFLIIDDPDNNNLLTLIDLRNQKVVKRFLKKGKGPKECIVIDLYKYKKREFYVYGKSLHKLLIFNIDSILNNNTYTPKAFELKDNGNYISVLPINDSYYIGTGTFKKGRYGILKEGNIRTKYSFPKDGTKYSIRAKSAAYGSELDMKPDMKKFVSSVNVGEVIEIFSIKHNTINKIKKLHYSYPKYHIINGGEGLGYGAQYYEKDNKFGFTDVYTTNNSIYTKYSGKKLIRKKDFYTLSTGKHILVYDWKGKPKRHYELDYHVEYICVNKNETAMYAITYKPEPKIIKFKLPS
jgi:hypothetical protein